RCREQFGLDWSEPGHDEVRLHRLRRSLSQETVRQQSGWSQTGGAYRQKTAAIQFHWTLASLLLCRGFGEGAINHPNQFLARIVPPRLSKIDQNQPLGWVRPSQRSVRSGMLEDAGGVWRWNRAIAISVDRPVQPVELIALLPLFGWEDIIGVRLQCQFYRV